METLWQVEANIDDMNPQNMDYVFRRLLDLGVNDVWAMPMLMKKCRMAAMLCVLCREELLENVEAIIFAETTSVGVRYFPVNRIACERAIREKHCIARFAGMAGAFPTYQQNMMTAGLLLNARVSRSRIGSAV